MRVHTEAQSLLPAAHLSGFSQLPGTSRGSLEGVRQGRADVPQDQAWSYLAPSSHSPMPAG